MSRGALALALALALAAGVALGCAPIDVRSEVSVHPREASIPLVGVEQLARRDFVVDYVQLGARLLVSLREHRTCVGVNHVPVMRVEQIERRSRGFVAWDFALGGFFAGFSALAFAQPQLFSPRLVDNSGRQVINTASAYAVGGLFAAVSVGLLAAGVVDGMRARDETRYAAAFQLSLGPEGRCAGDDEAGRIVAERALTLRVDEREYAAQTDVEGRARFELASHEGPIPADGRLPAVLEIAARGGVDLEPRVVAISLRVPFEGMLDAHTGTADTRKSQAP